MISGAGIGEKDVVAGMRAAEVEISGEGSSVGDVALEIVLAELLLSVLTLFVSKVKFTFGYFRMSERLETIAPRLG